MTAQVVTKNVTLEDGSERVILVGVFTDAYEIQLAKNEMLTRIPLNSLLDIPLYRFVVTETQRKISVIPHTT